MSFYSERIPSPELLAKLAGVKLLALDVDGVLTDGGLYYSETGQISKCFNVKDGWGLNALQQQGLELAVISASGATATLHRCQTLGITHVFIGVGDKLATLHQLCQHLRLTLAQVAYVGDDVNDLPVLKQVGCPFTVADGMPMVQNSVAYVTERPGGKGAVREICDLILYAKSLALGPDF